MGKGALKDIYDVMIALIKKGPRPTYETREYEDSDTEEEDLGTISCEEDDPQDSIENGEGEGHSRSESRQRKIESIRDHFCPFADKKKRCLDQRRYPWYAFKQRDYFTLYDIGQENLELMQGVERRIAKAHKKHSSGLKDLMLHEIFLRKWIYRSMKPGETLRDLKVPKAIQERFAGLEKEVYECKQREKNQQDLQKYWTGYKSTIDAINNEIRFLGSSPIHRPDVPKKLSWLPKCDSMLKFKIVNARKAIQIGILVDTHPFSVDHCILCDQQLLSTSIAHLVVECEQVAGHRIQSGLVPAIQTSRLRLLGRALDPGVENVYTWLRGGVLNGEADLDQRWLDGTVEHESMGTRHDNRVMAARLVDFFAAISTLSNISNPIHCQPLDSCLHISSLSSLNKLLLPGTLRIGPSTHVDTFFVDCGADDLFVDSKLAADLHIPLVKLSTPIQLRLADGDSSSVISHRTVPLQLHIGSHVETASFYWTLTLHTAWKIAVLDLLEFKGWENPPDTNKCFPPTVVSDTSKSLVQLNPISGDCSLASILSLDSIQEGVYPFVEASPLSESGVPADILSQFESVFSKDLAETLPPHRDFDCSIELIPGSVPAYGKIYHLTREEDTVMQEWIKDNLRQGFIRSSSSPHGAPCFFVKQKDKLRLCMDYRGLNKNTIKDRNPIPLISEMLRTLSTGKVFTTLDLRGAYNLLRIKEGDEPKTSFHYQIWSV
ncbi:hypothetical protein BASA60_004842 [Batrachochytrium salamandrivorans]|nr:hypothetical protein BASA60_004842 [Batrachochytrium salamandrivorans]